MVNKGDLYGNYLEAAKSSREFDQDVVKSVIDRLSNFGDDAARMAMDLPSGDALRDLNVTLPPQTHPQPQRQGMGLLPKLVAGAALLGGGAGMGAGAVSLLEMLKPDQRAAPAAVDHPHSDSDTLFEIRVGEPE